MTTKQILDAQKVLRLLDGTPIRMSGDRKTVQVTYDMETYNALLGVLMAVSDEEPKNVPTFSTPTDYHREKI